MMGKRNYRRCQNCRYPLNPKFNIGNISCCDKCGWAGSQHSENFEDWVQLKVSAILIVFGLASAFAITKLGPENVEDLVSSEQIVQVSEGDQTYTN